MSRPQHKPTPETTAQARTLAGLGVPQEDICRLIGVSLPTLHRHYRAALDIGMAQANATVSKRLFDMTATVPAAAMFWCKTRMGWKEKAAIEVTGEDGAPISHRHTLDAEGAIGRLLEQLAAAKATGEGQG